MTDLTELAIEHEQEKSELVNKIEELNKWLDLKSEYIGKLEAENKKLKELLEECRDNIADSWDSFIDIAAGGETAKLIEKINEVLK